MLHDSKDENYKMTSLIPQSRPHCISYYKVPKRKITIKCLCSFLHVVLASLYFILQGSEEENNYEMPLLILHVVLTSLCFRFQDSKDECRNVLYMK